MIILLIPVAQYSKLDCLVVPKTRRGEACTRMVNLPIHVVQDSKLDGLFMLELATSPIRRTEPELVSVKLKLHVWAV